MDMPWLACHNLEIDWRIGEVQITRCLEKCGKKWRIGRQTKPGQQKQEEREKQKERKEFRKLTTEEEIAIARIVEEKEEKRNEEDLESCHRSQRRFCAE